MDIHINSFSRKKIEAVSSHRSFLEFQLETALLLLGKETCSFRCKVIFLERVIWVIAQSINDEDSPRKLAVLLSAITNHRTFLKGAPVGNGTFRSSYEQNTLADFLLVLGTLSVYSGYKSRRLLLLVFYTQTESTYTQADSYYQFTFQIILYS